MNSTLLSKENNQLLRQSKLQGELTDSYISYQSASDWQLKTTLNKLSWHALQKIPGVANLSGALDAQPHQGRFNLQSQKIVLDINHLFSQPLAFNNAKGIFNWHDDDSAQIITGQHIVMHQQANQLGGDFKLTLPKKVGKPELQLLAGAEITQLNDYRHFLPSKIMSPKLVEWLQKANISANGASVTALYRGALADFPLSFPLSPG